MLSNNEMDFFFFNSKTAVNCNKVSIWCDNPALFKNASILSSRYFPFSQEIFQSILENLQQFSWRFWASHLPRLLQVKSDSLHYSVFFFFVWKVVLLHNLLLSFLTYKHFSIRLHQFVWKSKSHRINIHDRAPVLYRSISFINHTC